MGVFNDGPLILIHVMALLILEMLSGLEVTGMAQIAGIRQHMDDRGATPGVWIPDISAGMKVRHKQKSIFKHYNSITLGSFFRKHSFFMLVFS